MSSALIGYLLIAFIGPVIADDRPISDSSIAALSVVFGFIFLVIILSTCCHCVRKKRRSSRRKRVEKLEKIKRVFQEHFSEHTFPADDMVTNEKPQKYTDWRRTQPTSTVNSTPVVLTTQAPSRESRYFVRSNRRTTRSISPTRNSPRTPIYERGRSRQKFVYPSQDDYNTLMKKRSKSAPAVNHPEYVPGYPNRQLFYTKSHYLAIKQPFSKKYLLPPVLTYYAERPVAKRVIVPPPPPQVFAPPPPPPKREVYKPQVYHIQYQPSQNQVVHRGPVNADIDEDFRLQTTTQTYRNSYQNVRSYEEPVQTTYRSYEEPAQTTYRSYEEPVQTTYRTYEEPIQTTLTNYKPRVIRPEPYVYRLSGSEAEDIGTTEWSGNRILIKSDIVHASEGGSAFKRTSTYTMNSNDEARVANGTEQTKTVADDYTIVDFVEEDGQKFDTKIDEAGPSGVKGTGAVTVLSTSSPGETAHNSSGLNDLDNFLGDHESSSSSSSSNSSSSSSKSSK